jgi:hypothetical protein
LTIDEELVLLEDSFRRLKIEFDIYFAGGANKKPPADTEYRVQTLIRRNLENSRLTYPQRFRLNAVAHKYTVFSDLWRRKAKIKEEGYRRPQDALLGVGGFGHLETPESHNVRDDREPERFLIFTSDIIEVVALYEAVVRARESAGQPLGAFDSFAAFVQQKSNQIRAQFNCEAVEYTVMVQGGQVRLKARARKDL